MFTCACACLVIRTVKLALDVLKLLGEDILNKNPRCLLISLEKKERKKEKKQTERLSYQLRLKLLAVKSVCLCLGIGGFKQLHFCAQLGILLFH